jgi:hypothetical protein
MDPALLSIDSPMVITMVSDLSEFTGGPQLLQLLPDPSGGAGSGGEPAADATPDVFIALCHGFHPAGTPGARPEGGSWAGELHKGHEHA